MCACNLNNPTLHILSYKQFYDTFTCIDYGELKTLVHAQCTYMYMQIAHTSPYRRTNLYCVEACAREKKGKTLRVNSVLTHSSRGPQRFETICINLSIPPSADGEPTLPTLSPPSGHARGADQGGVGWQGWEMGMTGLEEKKRTAQAPYHMTQIAWIYIGRRQTRVVENNPHR